MGKRLDNNIYDCQSLLSRENSLILRGAGILFIVLHNFLHLSMFNFSPENEMSFSLEHVNSFFNAIKHGINVVPEFFSHLGWIGVPVFVFLTGYGLALHLPPSTKQETNSCIKNSYLKLFALMLPAILFFALGDVLRGECWPGLVKRFSYLTMLVNFGYPYVNLLPGVYWYFGLTFQFYLLWALFGRYMNGKNLFVWSFIFLVGLLIVSVYGSSDFLSIYRHCFTGWFPVFAIGVWVGMNKIENNAYYIVRNSVLLEIMLFVLLGGGYIVVDQMVGYLGVCAYCGFGMVYCFRLVVIAYSLSFRRVSLVREVFCKSICMPPNC